MSLDALIAQFGWWLMPLMVWSIVWKGIALWKAARLSAKWWFVALLVVNTAGLLEMLYIFVFSKMSGGADNAEEEESDEDSK